MSQHHSKSSPDTNLSNQDAKSNIEDDWLFTDPLGLDNDSDVDLESDMDSDMDSGLESEAEDAIATDCEEHSTNDMLSDDTRVNHLDSNFNDGKMNSDSALAINQTHSTEQIAKVSQLDNEDAIAEFDGDTSRANPNFKPLLPNPTHRGEPGRQLIMDTETTGLDALKGDRVIEVGIVELVDRKFTGEKLHVYINPKRGMDDEVIRIHGITEAFLADKPTFDEVAQKLYDFMSGAEIIAHNAPFDMTFLSMEFDKVGLTDFADKVTVTDSLVMAKQQYPGQKNTLDALVRRLNVGKMDRTFHGALLDAEILAEVYLAMTGGQVSLAIDEDAQSEGGGSHTDFSHLADKLISAKTNFIEHFNWVASLIANNPNLSTLQEVHCLSQITDEADLHHCLQPNSYQVSGAVKLAEKLKTSLFIKT